MTEPAVELTGASLSLGGMELWRELNLKILPGEILAVLGPNGSGKSSLLNVLLGLLPLTSGRAKICGYEPKRGSSSIGYVPQQRSFDESLPLRGRDLVRLGLDGHRFGISAKPGLSEKVNVILDEVGASAYADSPVGLLSGGEQQRLRIAQALLGDPKVLLCDEPLLSLDLSHQQSVIRLIDERRKKANVAVVLVTHEINPVLPIVDRVLYIVDGRWAVGKPLDVFTTEKLSELYGTQVDVLNVRGRVVIVGANDALAGGGGHHG